MGRTARCLSALAAGMLAFVVGTSTAHALSKDQYKCQTAIAKEGLKYVSKRLKTIQKCNDANLALANSCPAPDFTKLIEKLRSGIAKKCSFDKLGPGFDDDNLATIGFPGPCRDPNPANGFTVTDLEDCIESSHTLLMTGLCSGGTNTGESCTTIADCPDQGAGTACQGIIPTEYDPSVTGPLTGATLKCQSAVSKNSIKFLTSLMKAVQKCRNALLNCKQVSPAPGVTQTVCKLSGVAPQDCATGDQKTKDTVDKARDKAVAAIEKACSDASIDVPALKLCTSDAATASDAATCEVQVHQDLADNPDPGAISDLIDYEYAQPGICGDNHANPPGEECDGVDDAACPGLCGAPSGFFPCLCQGGPGIPPRQRVIEHANADLDNGWTGNSHDSGIVEGGGYVADLFDCDGPGGPDTLCTVGPSCNLPPHQACSPAPNATGTAANADSICTGVGNFCRKTAGGATGPHCAIEFKRRCSKDGDCSLAGDYCVMVPHGAPLPLVSLGVAVCVQNTFSEDVVGTTDLATGEGAVRLRQGSATFPGETGEPCPVCGHFCTGPASTTSPGSRTLCTTDADCSGGATCVTAPICSFGLNKDKSCRPDPPFGGPTEFFGNPSIDCPIGGNPYGTIDILFNPASTQNVSLTANKSCGPAPGINGKKCVGGANEFRSCTVDSECPGGTCNNQCFCNTTAGLTQYPNGCANACRGGGLDAQPCGDDLDCPGGFCNSYDCRVNGSDTDSAQEGACTAGPSVGHCSGYAPKSCNVDADCAHGPGCPQCGMGETCTVTPKECFVWPTMVREGSPGVPDRTSAAIFCIKETGASAVDGVAGLPGPGAITNPTTTIEVGF